MRSLEEIEERVKSRKPISKIDIYGASLIQLFPFVRLESIPEVYRNKFSDEAKKMWSDTDIQKEVEDWDFKANLKDEVDFIYKLSCNEEVNAAVFRLPRALAIIWLNGDSVTELDKKLTRIVEKHYTLEKARREVKRICSAIRELYGLTREK